MTIEKKNTPKSLYYWGLLGLIPNFGFIGGVILLIKGLFQYNDKKLVIIGIADMLFTFIFWISFIYWTENGKTFIDLKSQLAQQELNTLVKDIEFYKLVNKTYPDSLRQLEKDKDLTVNINEPFYRITKNEKSKVFNYYRDNQGYHLFSSGYDEIPNTDDDIFPTLKNIDSTKIGLILK